MQLIIWEGMVLNMLPIERTVCMQQLHYPLSTSCICGTVHNFDPIVYKICVCLENGGRTGDSEYGSYWIDTVCVISNASFDEITEFYPIVTKFSTCAAHILGKSGLENGANRMNSLHATIALSFI